MANKKRKSNGNEDASGGGGWEVVFSGFVLILLCFFIMLCSFSSMETSKVSQFVKSFSLAVSIFSGGLNFDQGEIMLPVSLDIVEAESQLANIFEEMKKIMDGYGVDGDVEMLEENEGGFVIRLADRVLFETGQGAIDLGSNHILTKIGSILAKTAYQIRIEGHTDNIPINTEKFPSNWELSTTRAISVLRYFIDVHGISANRLSAEGFGKFRPIVPNDLPENQRKNRRVEIKIFEEKPKQVKKS